MTFFNRILLVVGIVAIDLVFFVVPLTAIFLAYILLVNPLWFRNFLEQLDPPNPPTHEDQRITPNDHE